MLALAALSAITCTAESPPSGSAVQAVINPPLPNLNLVLHAKTTITIGPFSQVFGDVASSGLDGSLMFDVSSVHGFLGNALASTVEVRVGASVGHIFSNDITVDGTSAQQTLGLDPEALPAVPAVTAPTPGTATLSVAANQTKQACPGQYGVMSLGPNARLNLNGGVYHVTRLSLAEGARLEPSEPVVLLVAGNLVTGARAAIEPSLQAINPMTAGDIRIEVGGAATFGDGTRLRAHLLVPNGKFATGKNVLLTGAAWARSIAIGTENGIGGDGVFSTQAPTVPPPCNDNNACTSDQCVGSGTAAFCRNAPAATGTSCEDGNTCNGAETCSGAGTCNAGTPPAAGSSCADGDLCNGDETCDGLSTCLGGAPPVVSDDNACTSDSCDPLAGVINDPVADGTTCSGRGVCEAGVCSVTGAVFSEDFFPLQDTVQQCNRWNDFLLNQLSSGSFSSVSMSGSFDPLGVTCSDPAAATRICRALHDGIFDSVSCGGRTWNTGQCGGTELSVDVGVCLCSNARTVRPCIGADFWGGVNTPTCLAPAQNITVVCE
jgi:hypothetical protein